jgi:hypothetical protein
MLVLVDGRRPVGEILEMTGIDEFTGLRTLYGLISSGLADVLTLGPVDGIAEAPPTPAPPLVERTIGNRPSAPGGAGTATGGAVGSGPGHGRGEEVRSAAPIEPPRTQDEPETLRGPEPVHSETIVSSSAQPAVVEADSEAPEPEGYPGGPEVGVGRRFDLDAEVDGSSEPPPLQANGAVPEGWFDTRDDESFDSDSPSLAPTETTLTDLVDEVDDANPIAPALGGGVDREAVVRELAGLFGESQDARVPDDEDEESEQPAQVVDGRKRVEDDDQIDQKLIGRLIDGLKGL